jgi:hypothetical protein
MEDSEFSDKKFQVFPKINHVARLEYSAGGSSNANHIDRYDRMINSKSASSIKKLDFVKRKHYEKFIQSSEPSQEDAAGLHINMYSAKMSSSSVKLPSSNRNGYDGKEDTIVISQSPKVLHKSQASLVKPLNVLEPSFLQKSLKEHRNLELSSAASSAFRRLPERRDNQHLKSFDGNLLPGSKSKSQMADTLVSLKAVLDDCARLGKIPTSQLFAKLLVCFEMMVSDDSHYSELMRRFIKLIRMGIFVTRQSREENTKELLSIHNVEVSSLLFSETSDGMLTQYECLQKVLQEFKNTSETARQEKKILQSVIDGTTSLTQNK